MSFSFGCQICGVDMAPARIRTSDEPPSAAWDYQGANYVGFTDEFRGQDFEDEECHECTTADRTPADPQTLEFERLPLWPECDEDDPEWILDSQTHNHDEPLEYDSGLDAQDSDNEPSGISCCGDSDSDGQGGSYDGTPTQYNLSGLFDPPKPERLPHGTWHKGFVYYTGNRKGPQIETLPRSSISKFTEHIASPACRSLRGINGHVLSLAQMKNCRNVRFLVPKPPHWRTDVSERLLEESSLFYLSGESNGSNPCVGRYYQAWRSFYPPRHGLHELNTSWDLIGEGCDNQEYDQLRPLAVHSYCLDMYAKLSYHRLGRVDLDGLWYWREIETRPDSYGMGKQEFRYGGQKWNEPANVGTIRIYQVLESCMNRANKGQAQLQNARLLALPTEILHHIMSFLDLPDIDIIAKTCRRLYEDAQPIFKAYVFSNMYWLWEICEGSLLPPSLPVGLESKEAEDRLWAEIIAEYPEMEGTGNAVKALNCLRRDEIFGPYRTRQESSLHEWHTFRAGVEAWIRLTQGRAVYSHSIEGANWRRIWWLFNPATTPLPGVRNRARIWHGCEHIMDCVALAHELGEINNKQQDLHAKLLDPGLSTNIYNAD
ncbi:hypothetical protein FDECE_2005 [Fusarium decemcellulare]|nr:hypothetical protein FDECE_2005 [Fusarium decemcellulare]